MECHRHSGRQLQRLARTRGIRPRLQNQESVEKLSPLSQRTDFIAVKVAPLNRCWSVETQTAGKRNSSHSTSAEKTRNTAKKSYLHCLEIYALNVYIKKKKKTFKLGENHRQSVMNYFVFDLKKCLVVHFYSALALSPLFVIKVECKRLSKLSRAFS